MSETKFFLYQHKHVKGFKIIVDSSIDLVKFLVIHKVSYVQVRRNGRWGCRAIYQKMFNIFDWWT